MKAKGCLHCDHTNIPSEGLNPLNYNSEILSSAMSQMASLALNTEVLYLKWNSYISHICNWLPLEFRSIGFVLPLNRSCGFLGVWQPLESQFAVVYAYFTKAAPHGISQRDSSKHVAQHFKWPMKGKQWGALQAFTSNPAFPLGRTWTHTEEFIWMWGKNH